MPASSCSGRQGLFWAGREPEPPQPSFPDSGLPSERCCCQSEKNLGGKERWFEQQLCRRNKFRGKRRDDLTNHCCSASAIVCSRLPFSQQKSHPWMIKGLTRDFDNCKIDFEVKLLRPLLLRQSLQQSWSHIGILGCKTQQRVARQWLRGHWLSSLVDAMAIRSQYDNRLVAELHVT